MKEKKAARLIMVGMATENSLGYQLELFASRPQELWLLQTPHAVKLGYGRHLQAVCALLGCKLSFFPVKNADSLVGLAEEIVKLLASSSGSSFLLNLAGGIKHHNLALWEVFRQRPESTAVVFNNLQNKIRLSWSVSGNEVQEKAEDITAGLTLDSLARLYGCELKPEAELYVQNAPADNKLIKKLTGARYVPDMEAGYRWEKWVAGSILLQIKQAEKVKVSRLVLNAKVYRADVCIAEYDLVVETTDQRIILVECKAGKFTLKDIKSQASLAAEWGAAFAEFALCVPVGFTPNEPGVASLGIKQGLIDHHIKVFAGPGKLPKQTNIFPLSEFLQVFRLRS